MDKLLIDLDHIFEKVQNLKMDNNLLREKVNTLENINRQLKVEVDHLNQIINTDNKDTGSRPELVIDRDTDHNDDILQKSVSMESSHISEREMIDRLSLIETEIDDCLQMLENKS